MSELVQLRRKVHKRTENHDRWTRRRVLALRVEGFDPEDAPPRPVRRGDCVDGPRPCPWVSCRHHLAIDVQSASSLTLYVPTDEEGNADLDVLPETCSLDVADRGEHTLEELGEVLGCTRENVRLRLERGLARFEARHALVRGDQ